MKKNIQFAKLARSFIILFLTYMVGFIGTILIINKQIFDITNSMVDANVDSFDCIKYFSFDLVNFEGHVGNDVFTLNVIKSNWFDYVPFINGGILLILTLILMFIVKKFLIKK